MTVAKRKTSAGLTEEYHYAFMQGKKRFSGVCEGCKNKNEAEIFEKNLKKIAKNADAQKTPRALIENFRQEMFGGTIIPIENAFEMAMEKPRKKSIKENEICRKQSAWNDFTIFLKDNYPNVKNITSITKKHAEEYIAIIRKKGKYFKKITYNRNGKIVEWKASENLSNRTANFYLVTCKEIMKLLTQDAGLLENPFDIQKLSENNEERQAFSKKEIETIFENLDEFTKPLFTIAIATALREGDICTIKWDDIDFKEKLIRKKMNKTGKYVEIPISDELLNYILEQKKENESKFVFPKLAQMYSKNRTGVSYRIKIFLEKLGIKTTLKVEGRSRVVSVKDLHSCRHTFCYNAGLRGVPLSVVQSVVGHMSPEMTRHYSAHVTLEDKRVTMRLMDNFFKGGREDEEQERKELIEAARGAAIDKVRKALALLKEQ